MPPFADSNRPIAVLRRAGERPAHVTEQLALEQRLGHRRAVDGDERPRRRATTRRGCSRATRSLPTPLSPVMSTVESTRATRRATSSTCCIRSLCATMPVARSCDLDPGELRRSARSRCSADFSCSVTSFSASSRHMRSKKRRSDAGQFCHSSRDGRSSGRCASPFADAVLLEAEDASARDAARDSRSRSRPASSTTGSVDGPSATGAAPPRTSRARSPPRTLRRLAGRAGHRLVDEQPLQLVQPPAGELPLVLRVPRELVPHRLRRAPAVRVPEPREDAARRDAGRWSRSARGAAGRARPC